MGCWLRKLHLSARHFSEFNQEFNLILKEFTVTANQECPPQQVGIPPFRSGKNNPGAF
jgi:hypothetical protein